MAETRPITVTLNPELLPVPEGDVIIVQIKDYTKSGFDLLMQALKPIKAKRPDTLFIVCDHPIAFEVLSDADMHTLGWQRVPKLGGISEAPRHEPSDADLRYGMDPHGDQV